MSGGLQSNGTGSGSRALAADISNTVVTWVCVLARHQDLDRTALNFTPGAILSPVFPVRLFLVAGSLAGVHRSRTHRHESDPS